VRALDPAEHGLQAADPSCPAHHRHPLFLRNRFGTFALT
jgi:hypothetical protein